MPRDLRMNFTDVDECTGAVACSQGCVNEDGGFRCTCWQGYLLDQDGTTCNGISFYVMFFFLKVVLGFSL